MHKQLAQILAPHLGQRGALVPVLQNIQEELGYLPEEAISDIAHFLRLSESEVYYVFSFYCIRLLLILGESLTTQSAIKRLCFNFVGGVIAKLGGLDSNG